MKNVKSLISYEETSNVISFRDMPNLILAAPVVVAKSHSAILHICSISLRCDPSWFFNGETKCR